MIRKTIIVVLTLAAVGVGILLAASYWSRLSSKYVQPSNTLHLVNVGVRNGAAYLVTYRSVPSYTRFKSSRLLGFTYYWQEHYAEFGFRNGNGVECTRIDVQGKCYKAPMWLLLILFATYPAIAFIRGSLRRYRHRRRGLCLKCGYDLTGNISGTCPECGTETEQR